MFSQEKVLKILQLSSEFYQTTDIGRQKLLSDQVLALTTLPPVHRDPDHPLLMKKLPLDRKDMVRKMSHRPTHPPMASLINEAIEKLHERNGSSLQAIKKFISQSYHLDTGKLARYIRKYLRDAVDNGILLHPTGRGATGHFKLAKKAKKLTSTATAGKRGRMETRKPHPKSTETKKRIGPKRKKKGTKVKAVGETKLSQSGSKKTISQTRQGRVIAA